MKGHSDLSAPFLTLLAGVLAAAPVLAADKVTYEDHVFPVLEQSCLNCHNPDKLKGGLDLSTYTGLMQGGSGGKVAEPGDSASSSLYTTITHTHENKMPPKGEKLAKKSTDLVRAWIDGGLLETSSSTARKATGPKIDLDIKIDASGKPDGPPPMPEAPVYEPVVVAHRASAVADMAMSPWSPLLAVTGQKQVLLYHTGTLRLAGILPFPAGQPEVLSFDASGRYLLAGGGIPGKSGTTITWDITTGEEIMRNGKAYDSILGASLRPDLRAVATGGPSRLIKLWDTGSASQAASIKKHTDWITSLAYSPDGILLATADRNGGAWVWEADSGNEFHALRAHQKGINAIQWRADSNLLATASEDGQVIFWEMNNGNQVKKITAHGGGVLALDYARNGHFATSGRDKKVKIWKPDFNLLKELPPFPELVVEVALTHDAGRLFAADWNGAITVWDAKTFKQIGALDANPPTLAQRITQLEATLAGHQEAASAARHAFQQAEARAAAARKAHNDTVAGRNNAKKRIEQIKVERPKLDTEWKQLDDSRTTLVKTRKGLQEQVQQHRQAITGIQTTIEAKQQAIKQLAPDGPPEDGKPEVTAKLKALRDELVKLDADLKQHNAEQQKAGQALQNTNGEWAEIESRRQQLADQRKNIGDESQQLWKQVAELEKRIQPTKDALTAAEKTLAPAKQARDRAQAAADQAAAELQFWKDALAAGS